MRIVSLISGLVGATIVALLLSIIFIIDPAFTRLAEDNANQESVRAASHLAASLISEGSVIARGQLPQNFSAEAEKVRQDFRLLRLRVLATTGEVIFSTESAEIGTFNRQDYFQKKVAQGILQSVVVRRGKQTLDGATAVSDVAETYVPLIRNGRVIGAFEIYYDISERMIRLDQVKARSNMLLFGTVTILLAITSGVVYRARRNETERDLAREEWEKTFEAVTDPIMIVSKDFTITRANRAMADWIGVTPQEAIGLTCYRQIHLCNEPIDDCPHKRLLADGKAHSAELYDVHSGRYFSVAVYPIFDSDGTLSCSVHYAKDITTSKMAEEELLQAETKYRIIADNTYAWEFLLGSDDSYIYTSPSCERITGYKPEEFTADPGLFLKIVHPDDRQKIMDHQSLIADNEPAGTNELMFRIIRRDDTVRWIFHTCQPIFTAEGEFLGIRGSNNDVTERKHAVDSLQESATSLAEAQRIAHLGSWEMDLRERVFKGSDETFRILEIDRVNNHVSQSELLERVHPADRNIVEAAFSRSRLTRLPVEIVHRLQMEDGRIKYVQDRYEAVFDLSGKPSGVVGTIQDVTSQKLAEEALRHSEEKFKGLAASAQDAIIMMDGAGKVSFWNDAAAAVFGYDRDEALGREVHRLIVPERFYSDFSQGFLRFQETGDGAYVGKTLTLLARKKDGTEFPVEFSVSALKIHEKWEAISILRDITERKRSEELIRQQLKNMTAVSDIGTAISSTLDIRVTLKILLDRLISQLKVDAASVLLLDQDSLYLTCAANLGFKTHSISRTSVRLGKGHAGSAAFERRILIIPDLHDTLTYSLKDENFRSYVGVPLIAQGKVVGVLELFHSSTINTSPEWISFLELMAAQAAIAIDNAAMFHDLQRVNTELIVSYDATLEGWGRTLEFRDEDTKGHTERVASMSVQFARLLGLDEREIVHLRRGAMLHDIGKISIPDTILLKPGPLSPEERKIMERHTVYAYELLKPIPFLRPALDIPYCHHEKWDGSGSPRGLKGEEIPLSARIFTVVDVWDALTTDRPYRKAWPVQKVKDYIRERSGSEFDPQVVELLMQHLENGNSSGIWNYSPFNANTPAD